jgi:hypothetical protein
MLALLTLTVSSATVHAASAVAALGGTLDRRIAELKQRVATSKNDQEAVALAHYYRAKGDLRNARKSGCSPGWISLR